MNLFKSKIAALTIFVVALQFGACDQNPSNSSAKISAKSELPALALGTSIDEVKSAFGNPIFERSIDPDKIEAHYIFEIGSSSPLNISGYKLVFLRGYLQRIEAILEG